MDDYPPLLQAGLHPLTMQAIWDLCVAPFPLSHTRSTIMSGLEKIISKIEEVSLKSELWIDGSFLTHKIDPNDVDIVMKIENSIWLRSTPEQGGIIKKIISQDFRRSHLCDSYFFIEYGPGEALYSSSEKSHLYWLKQFGYSRQQESKGIAIISTG